jgi:hypothetical protein
MIVRVSRLLTRHVQPSRTRIHEALNTDERRHFCDILFGMIFEILGAGTFPRDLSPFLNLMSFCLDSEWDESSQEFGGKAQILRTGIRQERYLVAVKGCTVLLLLLQIKPVVPNLFESFAHCCGSVEGAAGWILCAVVNSFDDTLRALGVRCVVALQSPPMHHYQLVPYRSRKALRQLLPTVRRYPPLTAEFNRSLLSAIDLLEWDPGCVLLWWLHQD